MARWRKRREIRMERRKIGGEEHKGEMVEVVKKTEEMNVVDHF